MKTFNKTLAEMILTETTAYKMKQISFKHFADSIYVWSTIDRSGCFHATEIIQLFAHPFSTYIQYDKEENRCELRIF